MTNVVREFHQAVVHPHPALAPEKPWEGGGFTCFAIFDEEEGLSKTWYLTGLPEGGGNITRYVVSDDEIHWHRPELHLHEVLGTTANNVVIPPEYHDGMDHWESMLKDSFDPDPDRRY